MFSEIRENFPIAIFILNIALLPKKKKRKKKKVPINRVQTEKAIANSHQFVGQLRTCR